MNLQIGKKYRTRDNKIVLIKEIQDKSYSYYKYGGIIIGQTEPPPDEYLHWTQEGRFYTLPCNMDIVEEVIENQNEAWIGL